MKNWFKRMGWVYAPVSWQGFLVLAVLLVFCLNVFLFVDGSSHSVSDTLYGVFPFFVPAFLVYLWIGFNIARY